MCTLGRHRCISPSQKLDIYSSPTVVGMCALNKFKRSRSSHSMHLDPEPNEMINCLVNCLTLTGNISHPIEVSFWILLLKSLFAVSA